MLVSESDQREFLIYGFRYALGRRTYVVSMCAEALARGWDSLHPKAKAIIERDLREAVNQDEGSRADGSGWHPLGDDCDRVRWLELLARIDEDGST